MSTEVPDFNFALPQELSPLDAKEVREKVNAIGRLNITADDNCPKNPLEGMPRVNKSDTNNVRFQIFYNGDWRTAASQLQSTITPPQYLEFEQSTPNVTWLIQHNLGRKPLVQISDTTGNVIYPDVQHTDSDNRVVITHSTPETGTVIIVG